MTTLLIIYCTYLLPFDLQAEEVYKTFSAGRFDLYFDSTYFKTLSNFGPNGGRQPMPVNSTLQILTLQSKVRYLFFNNLGVYTGLRFNNVESFNGVNTRANSVLSHFIFGGDFQIYQNDHWSLYTDISYFLSNVSINLNQDDSLPSDGASEIRGLFVGRYQQDSFRSFAKAGYSQRTGGLSSLLLYGAGAEFLLGYYSAMGLEFNGISTVKDDENTNTPLVRDALTDRVNAGSRIYYSINPNNLDAQIYYSYSVDQNFVIKFAAGASVTGSNSADGYHAGASLNWGFAGVGSARQMNRRSKKFIENSTAISDDDPGFKIDTDDGVNQELFKQVDPVPKK